MHDVREIVNSMPGKFEVRIRKRPSKFTAIQNLTFRPLISILQISEREYWHRKLVVQEIAVAKSGPFVSCGHQWDSGTTGEKSQTICLCFVMIETKYPNTSVPEFFAGNFIPPP
jgi:hypothetical protein